MKVMIEFNIKEEVYDQYEGILQEFLFSLDAIRCTDIEVTEE